MKANTSAYRQAPLSRGRWGKSKTAHTVSSLIPYIVIAVAATFTNSCFDDSGVLEATPSADLLRTEAVTLAADATEGAISLRSNCLWTATTTSSWLTVANAHGRGAASIGLRTTVNPWAEQRAAVVTLTTEGGICRDLEVVQLAATEVITTATVGIDSPATAAAYSTLISSNTTWSIVSAPDWLADIQPLGARGDATITFRTADNMRLTPRTGVIVARSTSSDMQTEIAISQAAAELPRLDSLKLESFGRTGATLTCRLLSSTFPVTDIGIVYAETAQPTLADSTISAMTADFCTGEFAVCIQSLRLARTYYARAYAVSPVGVAYGDDIVIQTYIEPYDEDNRRPAADAGSLTSALSLMGE